MNNYCRELGLNVKPKKLEEKKLLKLLDKGFLEYNGLVIYKDKKFSQYKDMKCNRENFHDKTSIECFINKFFIDDYITTKPKSKELLLEISISYTVDLYNRLANFVMEKGFEIITSFDRCANSVCSRFHVIRGGEFWLDCSDLENDKEEAILVISNKSF